MSSPLGRRVRSEGGTFLCVVFPLCCNVASAGSDSPGCFPRWSDLAQGPYPQLEVPKIFAERGHPRSSGGLVSDSAASERTGGPRCAARPSVSPAMSTGPSGEAPRSACTPGLVSVLPG